ncbi:HNH endonuclease [Vibrio phage 5P1b]
MLVAKAFVEGYKEGLVVDHIDEDKTNNHHLNLRWVPESENRKPRKFKESSYGKSSRNFKGTIRVYDINTKETYTYLKGNRDMLEKGFDPRNVNAVVLGKRRSYLGFGFERMNDIVVKVRHVNTISKSNFTPIIGADKDGLEVLVFNTYEDILSKGFTPLRVFRVLMGLERFHKGFVFKLQEEKD